jgi:very-short-patch-repair endonuclease
MHPKRRPSHEVWDLAAVQSDLLTTGQAVRLGLHEDGLQRLVDESNWRRLGNGLYDTAPGHDSPLKCAWTAALQVGEPYAIGGESALLLHGFARRPTVPEIWVPDDRRPRPTTSARVRRDKIGRLDRRVGSPSRICTEDAVLDVGQRLGAEALVSLLSEAIRLRLTTLERLQHALRRRRRVRHRALFADLLDDLIGVESTLEYVYRRDVERLHGLPQGLRQVSLSVGTRSDVLYDEQALIVELDGRVGHVDGNSPFRDLRRDNAHAKRNLMTLRYGSADVREKPCDVARQVSETLRDRGWKGSLVACPRCP